MTTNTFEQAIERATGESIEQLRRIPIDERRQAVERASGKLMRFLSFFPLIGRGNVLGDRAISHTQVEKAFRRALRGK